MKTSDAIPDTAPSMKHSNRFVRILGGYKINIPCIITTKNRVFLHGKYDLADFHDGGGITVRSVKLLQAIIRESVAKIIVYDLKSCEIIERVHWAENDRMVCDWVLLEQDMFEPEPEHDELLQFEF